MKRLFAWLRTSLPIYAGGALSLVSLTGSAWAADWTLERAIQTAEQASPTVERIEATIRSAQISRWETLTRLGPTVTLSGSLLRNDEEVVLTVPGENGQPTERIITPLEQASGKLSLTVPLLDPQTYAATAASARTLKATEAEGLDNRALFRLAVAGAYLDAVVAESRLQVSSQTLEVDTQRLKISRARAEVGRERQSAVLVTEAELLSAEQAHREAVARAASAREILSLYVHESVSGSLAPVLLPEKLPEPSPDIVDVHPSVVAARAKVAAAEATRAQAWLSFLPRVDGAFSAQVVDPAGFTSSDGATWSASVTGNWTLFNSGARALNARKASTSLALAEATHAELRETLLRELSRLQADATAAREQVTVAEARVKASERAAQDTRADYEAGRALLLELQSADSALAQARSSHIEAQARALRALLTLQRAYGRL